MAPTSRNARLSEDSGENIGMITAESSSRTPEWAERGGKSEKTAWWKYAAAAVVLVALFIPAVNYTSSTMLQTRVATAVEEILASQQKSTTTSSAAAQTTTSSSKTSEKVNEPEEGVEITLSNGTTIFAGNPAGGQTYQMHDCGSNAEEARAKGCSYDVMMQEWTPNECIDWTLAERFLKNGNWTWYADSGAVNTYDDVAVAKGDHSVVFVDQSYHRHHCIFTWEKLVRALRTGRPLVSKLVDYDHVMHCKMNTLKTFEEGAQPVRGVVAPTVFTTCASLDVWLANMPANKHSSIDRMLNKARDWVLELEDTD